MYVLQSLGQRMLEGMHTAANQSESDRHRRSDSIYTRPLLGEDSDVAEERKLIHDTPTKQLEQQSTVVLKVSSSVLKVTWSVWLAKVDKKRQRFHVWKVSR